MMIKFKAILACISVFALSSTVYAADVYKCGTAANPVYQDTPCEKGSKVGALAMPASSPANSSASLSSLFHQIQAAHANERRLQDDMNRDIAQTKARLGSKANDPSSNGESIRIKNEWLPKIQAAQRASEALSEELRRRCPKGALLNASTQSCRT